MVRLMRFMAKLLAFSSNTSCWAPGAVALAAAAAEAAEAAESISRAECAQFQGFAVANPL
jgi:DNA-binding transcriptional regulator YdaS (Cro superfamily)